MPQEKVILTQEIKEQLRVSRTQMHFFCMVNAKVSLISSHDTKTETGRMTSIYHALMKQNQVFEPEINPNTEKVKMQRAC